MAKLRFFTIEILLPLYTYFSLVFSSPVKVSLQSVNDSLVQSALHFINKNSPTYHTYTSGHLTSAQKFEELPYVIYKLTFTLNPICKEIEESCPEETCTIDVRKDEFGVAYVQKDSIQCIYLHPQSSQNSIVQKQNKELNYENHMTIKNLNEQIREDENFMLDHEIKAMTDQNVTTVIDVKKSDSNYCVGCPYDLNPHLPGLLAFNKQIEKQMDEVLSNDFKHIIISIVRVTRTVSPSSNNVQYQLLVRVGESVCLKNTNSSDCTLKSDSPIKVCLITFQEQPWQQNSRRIKKNNCTEVFHHNGNVTSAKSLVTESYKIVNSDTRQHNDNAYEGLRSILSENFTNTMTSNIEEHREQLVTEYPFVKLILNNSKDEEKSERFDTKNEEFDKFLENFDIPIKMNNNSNIRQARTNERLILSEIVSLDNTDKNLNFPNMINENINELNTNITEGLDKYFYKEKRSITNLFTFDNVKTRTKKEVHLVGSSSSKNVTDPEIIQYANLGLTKLSELSESENEPIIMQITEASFQVVSGLLYKIKVQVGLSNCSKGTKNNCQLKAGSEIKDCLITVWSQPWIDKGSPSVTVNCNVSERKKRSLKGAYYTQKMLAQAQRIKHERMFEEFIINFNKSYLSYEAREYRFKIFERNLKIVEKLRMYEQGTAEYGITMFMDLTPQEFKKQYLGFRPDLHLENQIPMQQAEIPDIQLPAQFDWRHYNVVTPVKNQGSCGSCWAFSVTGNIEGQYAIKYGRLLSLSEQELVDCDQLDQGCNGGLPDNAYRAIEDLGGLELESDYPYEAKTEKCYLNERKIKVKVASALNITSNEMQMAQWLVKNGPISVGINAIAMQFYVGGISHPWKFLCDPNDLDHGVLIVGYGIRKYSLFKKTLPYWIIKNSWGPHWGEQGYYRVYRGDGTCGLNKMATSAVVT